MNKLINKLRILGSALISYPMKWYFSAIPTSKLPIIGPNGENSGQLIVSLTSYGHRIKRSVYYTLISLLRQTHLPDRIILWVDNENWNEANLPKKLKKLRGVGVEIKFCEDLRSYKKLVPTLERYPDANIITVDDDVIYVKNFIETLWNAHCTYPDRVCCLEAHYARLDNNGILIPYSEWTDIEYPADSKQGKIFPVGVGGVLYPPNSLHPDVVNKELYQSLCPTGDDIWFWLMAVRQNTSHYVANLKHPYYSSEALFNLIHKNASLSSTNVGENKNDEQIARAISYFQIYLKK